jgi:hypothetical protein
MRALKTTGEDSVFQEERSLGPFLLPPFAGEISGGTAWNAE